MPNYISNKELLNAIVECQAVNIVDDRLARMLMLVVQRYSTKANFIGYSYRDDMIADALVHLVTAGRQNKIPPVLRFDATYAERRTALTGKSHWPNPLAFVTSIIHNVFLKTLRQEKNQGMVKDEYRMAWGLPSFSAQTDDAMNQAND